MLTIVIPTYWKRKTEELSKPEDFVFDHPTPIDGEDTLTRSLESLVEVEGRFNVVVITATVNHEIDQIAEKRVAEIISTFRDAFPVIQFSSSDLIFLKDRMDILGLNRNDLSLDGYSAIRNCQLIVPAILGSDIISAIDDDEIVEPDFVARAIEFVGKNINGKRADGIAGRYFYEWGSYRVREPEMARSSKNLFDRKAALQNDSYDLFDSREGRVVETSITLGGNMVFSRELFKNVPFDPSVTRGEDIDYLINSRMMGYNWMLDKELKIYHYPPDCKPQHKLQEDVIRFIYEKKKLELAASMDGWETVDKKHLEPYPGKFFSEEIEEHALKALEQRDGLTGTEAYYLSPEETLSIAARRAEKANEFFPFAERWKTVVSTLSSDEVLKKYFEKKF